MQTSGARRRENAKLYPPVIALRNCPISAFWDSGELKCADQ